MRKVFDDQMITSDLLALRTSKREFDNLDLLHDEEFENDLLLFLTTNYFTELAYEDIKSEIDTFIGLLSKEIRY